jgi:hypothetical protein
MVFPSLVHLQACKLGEISEKSLVSSSSVADSFQDSLPSAFLERLLGGASSGSSFHRLDSVLSFVPRAQLLGVKVVLKHEWGDGSEEEFYAGTLVGRSFRATQHPMGPGEAFDCGDFKASSGPVTVEHFTFIPEGTFNRTVFFYVRPFSRESLLWHCSSCLS